MLDRGFLFAVKVGELGCGGVFIESCRVISSVFLWLNIVFVLLVWCFFYVLILVFNKGVFILIFCVLGLCLLNFLFLSDFLRFVLLVLFFLINMIRIRVLKVLFFDNIFLYVVLVLVFLVNIWGGIRFVEKINNGYNV